MITVRKQGGARSIGRAMFRRVAGWRRTLAWLMAILWLALAHVGVAAATNEYYVIEIVDDQTGRGVPLAEIETVNHARWWTDSHGLIAFAEPGLMGVEVYFHVRSHGYEYPKDGFGNRGLKLKPLPGQRAKVKVRRLNIAERLYRVTGQGIYRDSVLAGQNVPVREPLLNGQVMGQDTVIATPYRGKIFWFWGDTDQAAYPLGNFGASGATSELPGKGGLDPSVGVDLTYFVNRTGFSKAMCPLPGSGLRWIEGLMTLPDESGVERLVARVANHRDLGYAHNWHLMVYNDEKEIFESVKEWDLHRGHDSAHPFRARAADQGYYYLYPNWRVKTVWKHLPDLETYEAWTCVGGDGKIRGVETVIDRDDRGRVRYQWRPGADRLDQGRMRELIAAGRLTADESWLNLRDYETGRRVEPHRSSVFWNPYRGRWIMIFSGLPGEIWFAEGDSPTGPWLYGRRVVSHENYNFYNPTQHPFFDQEQGRIIYFEGTYTAAFSNAKEKTPRYDYNQIMYRLSLDDPRLVLPVPVYRVVTGAGENQYVTRSGVLAAKLYEAIREIPFYGLPRNDPGARLVPIRAGARGRLRVASSEGQGREPVLFWAMPAEPNLDQSAAGAAALAPLYEYSPVNGPVFYSVDSAITEPGVTRSEKPLCQVWRNASPTIAGAGEGLDTVALAP